MSGQRLRLGIFGTFDVNNYGDLLFPLVAEAELSRRLGPLKLRKFSYREVAPPDWPYAVTSLSRLPAVARELDGAIIGGGHVVRFDKAVAPGYLPPTPDVHHPTGYWLAPALVAQNAGLPVVWNAPGVHGEIPSWARPLLALALSRSAYISVRDEPSRLALQPFASRVAIDVVPDTAFGLAHLVDRARPSAELLRWRAELGLSEPYIIVQPVVAVREFVRFARDNPAALGGRRVLVLPICPVHGDDAGSFGVELPHARRPASWPHPLLLAELIAHADAVVGTSLHLGISALAFGVPVFRPADSFGGKYAMLAGYEGVARLAPDGGIDQATLLATPRQHGPSVALALERLAQHWDALAAGLVAARDVDAHLRAESQFWAQLPGLLEARRRRPRALVQAGTALVRGLAARPERLYHSAARKLPLRFEPLRNLGSNKRGKESEEKSVIEFSSIERGRLETKPYEWAFIDGLFTAEHAAALSESFPRDSFKTVRGYDGEKGYAYEARALIDMGEGAPAHIDGLSPAWRRLASDLLSPSYRRALGRLLRRDIDGLPMEVNVFRYPPRAWLGPHVDLKDKLITHVFYFNSAWDTGHGGCLNVLRSPDMADSAAEIAPLVGHSALLVRSEHSWHAVSRVVEGCARARLSMTVTFYQPGAVSTLWPPGDKTLLHDCTDESRWGSSRPASGLWARSGALLARLRSR